MWVVLIVVCVLAVLSIANPHARELTASAFWGVDQVITTLAGMLGAGLTGWLVDNRVTIATLLTLACGADVMALALLRSYKKGRGWQPRIRLYEWMELPRLDTAPEPAAVPYAVDELSRQWAAAMAVAGAWLLGRSLKSLVWAKDELWPAASGVAVRLTQAGGKLGKRSLEGAAGLAPAQVAEVRVLVGARSPGWYGRRRPVRLVHGEEDDEAESQETGRLAS